MVYTRKVGILRMAFQNEMHCSIARASRSFSDQYTDDVPGKKYLLYGPDRWTFTLLVKLDSDYRELCSRCLHGSHDLRYIRSGSFIASGDPFDFFPSEYLSFLFSKATLTLERDHDPP